MDSENIPGVILGFIVALTVIALAIGMLTGQNAQLGKDAQLEEVDTLHELMEGQCEISNTNSQAPEDITEEIHFKQIQQLRVDQGAPPELVAEFGQGDVNRYDLTENCDYEMTPTNAGSVSQEEYVFWTFTIQADQAPDVPSISVSAEGSSQ